VPNTIKVPASMQLPFSELIVKQFLDHSTSTKDSRITQTAIGEFEELANWVNSYSEEQFMDMVDLNAFTWYAEIDIDHLTVDYKAYLNRVLHESRGCVPQEIHPCVLYDIFFVKNDDQVKETYDTAVTSSKHWRPFIRNEKDDTCDRCYVRNKCQPFTHQVDCLERR
jgi:hypothetical protein